MSDTDSVDTEEKEVLWICACTEITLTNKEKDHHKAEVEGHLHT